MMYPETAKNYYIDMDGVLVLYDRNAYIGDNPLFLQKNKHYFRNLQPDRKILELIDKLYQSSRYTGDKIYILTSLSMNGAIFNEQFHDKIEWLHEWVPYIEIKDILISVTSKRDAVEYIHNHTLNADDILIDDYNKNLTEWREAGGTAVKYLNGINSVSSFNGISIDRNDSVDDIISILTSKN